MYIVLSFSSYLSCLLTSEGKSHSQSALQQYTWKKSFYFQCARDLFIGETFQKATLGEFE